MEGNMQTSLIGKLKTMSAMSVAIWLSLLIHAAILTVHFEPDLKKFTDSLPVLDVMLVNAKTNTMPDKADAFAQANLDRGGNTDQNRKMKSTLPALKLQQVEFTDKPMAEAKSSANAAKQTAEETKEQKHLAALEKQAQELMTQLNSAQKVESQPVQMAMARESGAGNQVTPNKNPKLLVITPAGRERIPLVARFS